MPLAQPKFPRRRAASRLSQSGPTRPASQHPRLSSANARTSAIRQSRPAAEDLCWQTAPDSPDKSIPSTILNLRNRKTFGGRVFSPLRADLRCMSPQSRQCRLRLLLSNLLPNAFLRTEKGLHRCQFTHLIYADTPCEIILTLHTHTTHTRNIDRAEHDSLKQGQQCANAASPENNCHSRTILGSPKLTPL